MALVPEELRRDLVIDLTERVVEAYYTARGLDVPEYSFVLHDRLTNEQDDGELGLQQLHTHVILPGLAPTVEGWEPIYNHKKKGHEQLFNAIAIEEFGNALDQAIGLEWRQMLEEPELEAQDRTDDLDLGFRARGDWLEQDNSHVWAVFCVGAPSRRPAAWLARASVKRFTCQC
jgi:hypothetical protein